MQMNWCNKYLSFQYLVFITKAIIYDGKFADVDMIKLLLARVLHADGSLTPRSLHHHTPATEGVPTGEGHRVYMTCPELLLALGALLTCQG